MNILKELPPDCTERALNGFRWAKGEWIGYHFCPRCDGWIEGFPGSAGGIFGVGGPEYRSGTVYTCRNCQQEIGFKCQVTSDLPEGVYERRTVKNAWKSADGYHANKFLKAYRCPYCTGWIIGRPNADHISTDQRRGYLVSCIACNKELQFKADKE